MDDKTRADNLLRYILDPKTPGGQSLREFSKSDFSDENFTFIDSINILEGLKSNSLDPSPDGLYNLNVKAALETIVTQLENDDVNISDATRQEFGPNITDYIIAVAKLFDEPRVYQAEKVRVEILDIANELNNAKAEVIKLIKSNTAQRWSAEPAIIDGKQVYDKPNDEPTKRALSNKEHFMVLADEWVKTVSPPTFDPELDPPGPGRSRSGAIDAGPGRSRSGAIDKGRVPLPEPIPSEGIPRSEGIPIPSEGIPRSEGIPIPSESNPIAQEGLPETTSPSEPTPIPENPFGERNEGGGE